MLHIDDHEVGDQALGYSAFAYREWEHPKEGCIPQCTIVPLIRLDAITNEQAVEAHSEYQHHSSNKVHI
jgi:hypothetical protein